MKIFEAKDIFNVALLGHTGVGKTSLAEAMLFNAKVTSRLGKVIDGTTVMDFDEQEIARNTSISLSLANFIWKDKKINLLDVPGFPDFDSEKVQALRGADSVIIVGGADGSVAVGTEKAIKYCVDNKIALMIFINQMDKENANFFTTLDAYKALYPMNIAPLQLPIMEGTKMKGFVNVLDKQAFLFSDKGPEAVAMPADLVGKVDELYNSMMEVAAENDEALLEKFFEAGELTKDELLLGLKKGVSLVSVMPVFTGSAIANKGVFNLMDSIIEQLPASNAIKTIKAFGKDGKEIEYNYDKNGKLMAQVFKTISDPFVGKLNIFKVFNGTLKGGMNIFNTTKDRKEKVNQVMIPFGKKQETVDEIPAGDIGAISKLSYTDTGDSLCDENSFIKFEDLVLPSPVISMCITAKVHDDEEKVFQGLAKLSDEDTSFTITKNVETNQTLINGMGEIHLEIICNKLKNKFKVDAALEVPKVPYRETIRKTFSAEGTHKKQSGGGGQYGKVAIRFEPYADGDFAFESEVVGGVVPKEYIPAVEKGLRDCVKKGVLAGYPVVNLKCVIFDGKYHPVDSNEISFRMAASLAYKEGLKQANPVLLEPIYSVDVTVPESYMGEVMGDFNKRRGRILGMEATKDGQVIHAEAPLSEIFKYATDLRSMTQGRGWFSTQLARYEEVPAQITAKVVEGSKLED